MRSTRSERLPRNPRRARLCAVFRQSGRGVALVAVLWMTAVLTVLVAGMSYVVRVDAFVVSHLQERARASALLDGALRLAASDLAAAHSAESPSITLEYEIDGVVVTVEAVVSSGFININAASETLLQNMFVYAADLSEQDALTLAQRIIDWRDPDDDPLPQGAERDVYKREGLSYGPRNAPFQRPDDLLQVLGLSPVVYDSIHDLVTTVGMGGQINPSAASEQVLAVLTKGDQALSQQIIADREAGQQDASSYSALLSGEDVGGGSGGGSDFRLRATVTAGTGAKWQRVAWMSVGSSMATHRVQRFPWVWHYAEPATTTTD